MEFTHFERAISFGSLIEDKTRENFQDMLRLLTDFSVVYEDELSKLPYHINIIDELHADENAHSRIFAKLLRYRKDNKYPFLEKFLLDVCKFKLCVEKPEVRKVDSCGRIDIPIFDNKYVVVIENKVTDKAPDQNTVKGGQLARYIETIKYSFERDLEDIYVVYTPKFTREPSEGCWINEFGHSYEDEFKERFISLSYRDAIYPWIKENKFNIIHEKDVYLQSATEQYIDHLEGMFNLRTTNIEMNMNLQEFIKQELKLTEESPEKAIEILLDKESELSNAMFQIQQLKRNYQKECVLNQFAQWEALLVQDFPESVIVGDKFKLDINVINLGVKFDIDNQPYVAIIECNDCVKPTIYYGVGRHHVSAGRFEETTLLNDILVSNALTNPVDFWYGWKYIQDENPYHKFKTLIDSIHASINLQE